ncbi:hypothetical protein CFIMG_008355RA00001 [Ceratocystis fimbriata CBS 114723]|uniref:DUF2423 domain-containing protein n=1 Tax=Ceratocystis fimbriata CBS 114723 TaxID=1035309 RepID=A0A2C5WYU7_9PEZI|nr:hypothetical protein CFIMG_008355RA00001 [Ceratocystis fimbriata CBS 114723]
MARSSRSNALKINNRKLKSQVFGPVEDARTQRLSAKLLELAKAPKPVADVKMDDAAEDQETEIKKTSDNMDVDGKAKSKSSISAGNRGILKKGKSKKSSIVFRSFKDRTRGKR